MSRRLDPHLALAAVLLLVTACSSPATAPPSVGQPGQGGLGFTADQLCALVTQAEVGAAVGVSVGVGVPSGVNAPACDWHDSNGSGATVAASGPSSVGQIPFGLQGVSGAHVTAVPGLGDAAFFASGAFGPTAELDIRKGGRAITITVGVADPNFNQAQQEAAELAIGKAAAGRM